MRVYLSGLITISVFTAQLLHAGTAIHQQRTVHCCCLITPILAIIFG